MPACLPIEPLIASEQPWARAWRKDTRLHTGHSPCHLRGHWANAWPPKGITALKRIHIVGQKNSGKTTLIAELVRYLTSHGHAVGTIKHTHHHHELDTPGKDSHRHREAGESVVGILSPGMNAVFRPRNPAEPAGEDRYAELALLYSSCDIVLVEGNLQTNGLKIEVWRAAASDQPIAVENPSIAAIVTDDPVEVAAPVWKRSDVASLAEHLLTR